VKTDKIT